MAGAAHPMAREVRQFVCKVRQHVAHGVQRRLEQDQAIRPVGIDYKVGGAMLDMQSLARSGTGWPEGLSAVARSSDFLVVTGEEGFLSWSQYA